MTPGTQSRAPFGQAAASAASLKWAALQDAANVVAGLAGLEPERTTPEIRNFPALIRDTAAWRRERGEDCSGEQQAPHGVALLSMLRSYCDTTSPAGLQGVLRSQYERSIERSATP